MAFKITEMYAFIATEADGTEGIPAAKLGGFMMPLVAADVTRLEQLKPIAELISGQTNTPIRLVRFLQMEEVEVIHASEQSGNTDNSDKSG